MMLKIGYSTERNINILFIPSFFARTFNFTLVVLIMFLVLFTFIILNFLPNYRMDLFAMELCHGKVTLIKHLKESKNVTYAFRSSTAVTTSYQNSHAKLVIKSFIRCAWYVFPFCMKNLKVFFQN